MNASTLQEAVTSESDVPLGLLARGKNIKLGSSRLAPEKNTADFPQSDIAQLFQQSFFPGSSLCDWNDWRWQIRNSFTSPDQLKGLVHYTPEEQKLLFNVKDHLPFRITPYYASRLLDQANQYAIKKAMIPGIQEFTSTPGEQADPLDEESSSPVPHLVHRYPDRVLFLATGFCSSYCRYCTRTHMVAHDKIHFNQDWEQAITYIENHKEIRDVLISGGDPLTMPDQMLFNLLSRLRRIPHVELLRIGTKVPVVLPQRITRSLTQLLKQFHPLMISIHFMHPAELTAETAEACNRLADAGIPLGSQTVLLKGINDDLNVMKKLMQGLLRIRVRPYYLYQCDPIPGSSHFRTPVSKGLEIIQGLRGFTSGYAVPHYVIDAPGGGGKIPLLPEYYQGKANGQLILKNYEGKTFYYPETE